VVFPAEIYPEKEGTITHPDGRIQRVRQALGHAGEVRPGWHVLADLCERAGAGVGALSARMVTDRIAADPPAAPDGLRLAAVPTLWTGPELDHSPSLRFLARPARVELSMEDARQAGIADGDEVRLVARADSREARVTAAIRTGVPPGTAILTGASLPEGPVELAPARPPVEAVAAGEVAR
jgi:NADH-quinone oxidoreductase subunit G